MQAGQLWKFEVLPKHLGWPLFTRMVKKASHEEVSLYTSYKQHGADG